MGLRMRLLLTNDDGIGAPGLAVLESIAAQFGEVVVAAPAEPHSGCGHQTTTNRPVRVETAGERRFCVYGSPADCVRLGLTTLTTGIDWVLAGVNDGGNLGVDVYMSGTVAAAREAAFFGLPAMAISQFRRDRRAVDWSGVVARRTHAVLAAYMQRQPAAGQYWNANFPDPPGPAGEEASPPGLQMVECPLELYPLEVAFEPQGDAYQFAGSYQQRRRSAGSDVDICFGGQIAISLLGQALPG